MESKIPHYGLYVTDSTGLSHFSHIAAVTILSTILSIQPQFQFHILKYNQLADEYHIGHSMTSFQYWDIRLQK